MFVYRPFHKEWVLGSPIREYCVVMFGCGEQALPDPSILFGRLLE